MVIFFLIQRFFVLNSYYKSRMAVFRSRLVIMISHDSFSFSYSNFSFSYSDFRISRSYFPISHIDFSISHINYRNLIGDFELIPLLSCLACHTRGRSSKSFTLCLYMKTIRAKPAKVQFAYFVQRDQHGIIAKT